MPAPTWTAGLFGGEPDDLAEAERRVAILKAELEAIRAGRKEASAAELRKLERDYEEAVTKVGELQRRVTPRAGRMRLPMIAKRGPTTAEAPPPRGVTTPRGYTARVGAPPTGGVGAVPGRVTTPRGYAAPPVGAGAGVAMGAPSVPPTAQGGPGIVPRISQAWQNLLQRRTALEPQTGGMGLALQARQALGMDGGQPARRTMSPQVLAGLTGGPQGMVDLATQRLGLDRLRPTGGPTAGAGGCTFMYLKPMSEWTAAEKARYPQCQREYNAEQRRMNEFQAGSLEARAAEASALAAWRQQQQAHDTAQLQQAWAKAQMELAHAQNVMASQIGTSLAGTQGQMWAQGLPYALPQGTQVAPGFERGGPMSQLHRMSGSQFTPRTGRISPSPPPSQQQLMSWVESAMQQYGAGR